MREAGPELWAWLKDGAHFYVCGDAKRMAKDVETALVEISAKGGQMSEAGARDFIAELKADGPLPGGRLLMAHDLPTLPAHRHLSPPCGERVGVRGSGILAASEQSGCPSP